MGIFLYPQLHMKKRKWNLSMLLPMGLLSVIGAGLVFTSCNDAGAQAAKAEEKGATKVLYVTMEPGRYHDYTTQKGLFSEISTKNKWDTTIMTSTYEGIIKKLADNPNFGDGYDVIVYNFCVAGSQDLNAPYNIIEQTKTKGIPAMLIHGTLHSFWPTYKERGDKSVHVAGLPEKARAKKALVEKWNKENPGKAFPSWASLTGIASTSHGPKTPVKTTNLIPDHGSIKGVPEYETVNAELYNNYISGEESKTTLSIVKGTQGKKSSTVLWEHPLGKSKVISFTLGHSNEEWKQPEFQQIITNSVNYLAANPSSAKE